MTIISNFVVVNATRKQVISGLCCAVHQLKECSRQLGDEICTPISGPETGTYIANLANAIAGDALKFSCRQKNLQQCKEKQARWMSIFQDLVPVIDEVKPQKTGIFTPLMILANKFSH